MSMPSTANFPTTRVSDHKGLTSSWVSFRSEDFFLSRCAANLSYSSGVRISFLVDETWKEALVAKYLHCSSFKMSLSDFQEHPKTIHCHPLSSIVIHCYPLLSIVFLFILDLWDLMASGSLCWASWDHLSCWSQEHMENFMLSRI